MTDWKLPKDPDGTLAKAAADQAERERRWSGVHPVSRGPMPTPRTGREEAKALLTEAAAQTNALFSLSIIVDRLDSLNGLFGSDVDEMIETVREDVRSLRWQIEVGA